MASEQKRAGCLCCSTSPVFRTSPDSRSHFQLARSISSISRVALGRWRGSGLAQEQAELRAHFPHLLHTPGLLHRLMQPRAGGSGFSFPGCEVGVAPGQQGELERSACGWHPCPSMLATAFLLSTPWSSCPTVQGQNSPSLGSALPAHLQSCTKGPVPRAPVASMGASV